MIDRARPLWRMRFAFSVSLCFVLFGCVHGQTHIDSKAPRAGRSQPTYPPPEGGTLTDGTGSRAGASTARPDNAIPGQGEPQEVVRVNIGFEMPSVGLRREMCAAEEEANSMRAELRHEQTIAKKYGVVNAQRVYLLGSGIEHWTREADELRRAYVERVGKKPEACE